MTTYCFGNYSSVCILGLNPIDELRCELPRVVRLATRPMGHPDVGVVAQKHQGRGPTRSLHCHSSNVSMSNRIRDPDQ